MDRLKDIARDNNTPCMPWAHLCWGVKRISFTCESTWYSGQENLLTSNRDACIWKLHILNDLLHLKWSNVEWNGPGTMCSPAATWET
jgi:hypothetical protein